MPDLQLHPSVALVVGYHATVDPRLRALQHGDGSHWVHVNLVDSFNSLCVVSRLAPGGQFSVRQGSGYLGIRGHFPLEPEAPQPVGPDMAQLVVRSGGGRLGPGFGLASST